MTKRELNNVLLATIVGILSFLAFSYFLNTSENFEDFPVPVTKPTAPDRRDLKLPEDQVPTGRRRYVSISANPPPKMMKYRNEQESLIKRFLELIRLEVSLSRTFHFSEVDLENNIASIYGREGSHRDIAIFASERIANKDEVLAFINEFKSVLPMLTGHEFRLSDKIQTMTPPGGSGIAELTILPGPAIAGSVVYAAYFIRSDKRGSYLFMMKARAGYFDTNEGEFENMLNSMKALPSK